MSFEKENSPARYIETEDGQQVEVGDLVYLHCSHRYRSASIGLDFYTIDLSEVVRIDQLTDDEFPLVLSFFRTTSGSTWAWNDERIFPRREDLSPPRQGAQDVAAHQSGCVYSIRHALTNGWLNKFEARQALEHNSDRRTGDTEAKRQAEGRAGGMSASMADANRKGGKVTELETEIAQRVSARLRFLLFEEEA